MTVAELLSQAYLLATGKAKALDATKKAKFLGLANIMQQQWENEPGIDWDSTYEYVTLADPISEIANAYALPANVRDVSKKEGDRIRIQHSLSGQSSYYDIVRPQDLQAHYYSNNVAAVIKRQVVFPNMFLIDAPQYGGSIVVPAYTKLPALVDGTDEVLVDDPAWLVYMTAAEYVRNDITKANQYGNLVAYAANSMAKMKEDNAGQLTEIPMFPTSQGETW